MRVFIAAFAALALASAFADTAPGAKTRSVTDVAGRVVELPAVVNRVAVPWHANNAMVLMLGEAEKIVATTSQAARQPWLRKLHPRIDEVAVVFNAAGDASIEALAGARPDAILMAYGGTLPRWLASADVLHIPVVMMPNTSLADLMVTARMTGTVLGERAARRAAEYVAYFDENVRRVKRVTDSIPPAERVRVLHTASAGILSVDGLETIVDDWIHAAGGINAATIKGNVRPVGMEQVIAWNPDVIIVGSAPNGPSRQAILDDPRWRQVKAVKEGRVYVNPSGAYLWDRHSAEAALQVLWAAKTLYPARFADLDIEKETRAFYSRFFGYTLDNAELRSILEATPPP